ncbi:MAG: hypothetical protein GC149_01865 [Gammaproteobacteria bacterium]|nr:hypothetical protein [Gammaproteobacteria bacterium]
MGSINYSQAIKPDTAYVKRIIENSLLSDWAIRIEYQSGESENTGWQLWDKTFFAISTAEAVLTALRDCYTKHPKCAIRLHAEKFRPQTRIVYTVYDPQYLPSETELKTQGSTRPASREYEQPVRQIRSIA